MNPPISHQASFSSSLEATDSVLQVSYLYMYIYTYTPERYSVHVGAHRIPAMCRETSDRPTVRARRQGPHHRGAALLVREGELGWGWKDVDSEDSEHYDVSSFSCVFESLEEKATGARHRRVCSEVL